MNRYEGSFLVAVNKLLKHEGGYNEVKGDAGGATNYGISLRYLQGERIDIDGDGDSDKEDIRRMTIEQAVDIYYRDWWSRHSYGSFAPKVGAKLLDMAVNMGARQAHKLFQHALIKLDCEVATDGVLGPRTRKAASMVEPDELVEGMRAECIGFYKMLVAKKPEYQKFLKGWLNRAVS